MSDLITVIIPVYKVEKHLPKCLESVINQTHGNLEIILVDDGSPDHCGKICDEYAERDKRIRVIHKKNEGVSAARNDGLAAATGAFIGFVDSDDYIQRDMYEVLYQSIIQNDADVSMCSCRIVRGEKEEELLFGWEDNALFDREAIQNELMPKYVFRDERNKLIMPSIWRCLFKKDLMSEKGIAFKTGLIYGEDLVFMLACLAASSRVVTTNRMLYNYNLTNESITQKYVKNLFANYQEVMQMVKKIFMADENGKKYEKQFLIYETGVLLDCLSNVCRKRDVGVSLPAKVKEGKEIVKATGLREKLKRLDKSEVKLFKKKGVFLIVYGLTGVFILLYDIKSRL